MDAVPAICHVTTSDRIRVAYHVSGIGAPLLLLFPYHVNDLVRNWSVPVHRQAIRDLAEHFTVINLDLRGAGQSQRDDVPSLTLDGLCEDVRAVLRDTGFDGAAVFAMGSSTLVAAHLAVTSPQTVSRLVLLGAGESETSERLFGLRDINRTIGSNLRASAVVGLDDAENSSALAAVIREAASPTAFAQYERILAQSSVAAALAGTSTPTLVVHASGDELIPLPVAERICAGIPASHLLVVPAASHFAVWRDELAVGRVVAFLGGAWSGAHEQLPGSATSARSRVAAPAALTLRERDVLRLVAAGKTNAQIHDELFISLNTVSHHLRGIYAKTGSANRTEAAAFAYRHGLA